MNKWILFFAISLTISSSGLFYFVNFVAIDICLDAGGRWLGAVDGCEGVDGYSMQKILSPLAIAIFIGIVVAITGMLFQLNKMFNQLTNR